MPELGNQKLQAPRAGDVVFWGREGLVPVCGIVSSWVLSPTSWRAMVSQAKPLNLA